jgi:hypothetical protein
MEVGEEVDTVEIREEKKNPEEFPEKVKYERWTTK